jgi:DNA-binding NarL/FixJ family response regulator
MNRSFRGDDPAVQDAQKDVVPPAERTIRVMLAEDHETVREGLKLLIDTQPDMRVVSTVENGRAAVESAAVLSPNVVVMDVAMPEMNGLVATKELKRTHPTISIVVLSRYDEDAYIQELLGAGASGYVLKRSPSSELLSAIRAVTTGQTYLDRGIGARMAGAMRKGPPKVPTSPVVSERENQVLRLMAHGHSNKEIAATLGISVKTVEVHKANAMRKLGFRGRTDVVQYALLQGWLRED